MSEDKLKWYVKLSDYVEGEWAVCKGGFNHGTYYNKHLAEQERDRLNEQDKQELLQAVSPPKILNQRTVDALEDASSVDDEPYWGPCPYDQDINGLTDEEAMCYCNTEQRNCCAADI